MNLNVNNDIYNQESSLQNFRTQGVLEVSDSLTGVASEGVS